MTSRFRRPLLAGVAVLAAGAIAALLGAVLAIPRRRAAASAAVS